MFLQIYVEIERARLTRMLAKIKEDEGDIAGNYCAKTQCKFLLLCGKMHSVPLG